MKVLIYVRKWNKNFYRNLALKAFDNPEITFISDFRNVGDIWSGDFIYQSRYELENELYEENKDDVIKRCRFLRGLEYQQAERISRRFWNGLEQVMQDTHYDVVLSAIIDCYTMDILERLAEKYAGRYFSLVQSFVRGYSRFTKRGELYDATRMVSDKEVEDVLSLLLEDSYKVSYALNKEKKNSETVRFFFYRKLVDCLYFPYMKHKERDSWNYAYNTLSFTEGGYGCYSIRKAKKYYHRLEELEYGADSVYLPLHYWPEATVDYWCDKVECAQYEDSIIQLIQNSDSKVKFVVKEHPAMYGKRTIRFYQRLEECGNVVIVHPYESSNELLQNIDNVLVYTGSVGVEALLRGKRVFTVAKNYYYGIHPNIFLVDRIVGADLQKPLAENEERKFMKELLAGMFPGRSTSGGDIDKSDLEEIANELRRFMRQE